MSQSTFIASNGSGGGGGPITPTYFLAYLNGNVDIPGGNTTSTIVFNNAVSNVGSAYNAATGIFTAPATGLYYFTTTLFTENVALLPGNTQFIISYKGSVQSMNVMKVGTNTANAATLGINASWIIPMAINETIKVSPFANGAGNYRIFGANGPNTGTYFTTSLFSGCRIS